MNQRRSEPPTDNHDLLKEWATYIKELLNLRNEERPKEIPLATNDLEICTDNFTLNELRVAIEKWNQTHPPAQTLLLLLNI